MSPHLPVLAAYSALLIGVGFLVSRGARSTSSFFVAGRALPARLVFATVLAANIGAGSTVGAAALGYQHGLAAAWWIGAGGLGTLILAVWLGPPIWRVAKEHRLHTVGDFLELRYGATARAALTGLLLLATLFVLAAQLIAAGVLVAAVAGISYPAAVLASALVVTLYFAAGGLKSAAFVNLIQLAVLMSGLLLALPWALGAAGGPSAIEDALGDGAFDVFGAPALALRYSALLIPAFLASPGILQKVFGGRDERAVRRGLLGAGVAMLLFAVVPPLLGLSAAVLHPGLERPDAALPTLLVETLPVWLGCLGVVALFSAEVSSADAVLFMLSTSLGRDIYGRFVNPEASPRQVLFAARFAAFLGGLAGAVLAIFGRSVVDSLTVFYSLLGVSLLAPIAFGLHRIRVRHRAVLPSAAAGVVAYFVGEAAGFLSPPLLGIVVSAVGLFLGRNRGRKRQGDDSRTAC